MRELTATQTQRTNAKPTKKYNNKKEEDITIQVYVEEELFAASFASY